MRVESEKYSLKHALYKAKGIWAASAVLRYQKNLGRSSKNGLFTVSLTVRVDPPTVH